MLELQQGCVVAEGPAVDFEEGIASLPAKGSGRKSEHEALRSPQIRASSRRPSPPGKRSLLQLGRDLVRLARPWEWSKNVFVLAPLLFSLSFFSLASVGASLVATGCFCLWASAVYFFNDILDAKSDRRHPRKCKRPIAAGRLSPATAGASAVLLVAVAGLVAWTLLPVYFLTLGGLYLLNSLLYCLVFKHRAICDVLAIAVGFVLRLLAGCAAIGVEPSSWALVCGFGLALTLGFGKRRAEIGKLDRPDDYRPALRFYNVQKLDMLLAITCCLCLLSYILYTVSPETVAMHGTNRLVFTIPFVVYGLFRFLFKVQEAQGDGPVEILTNDSAFAFNGVAWIGSVVTVLLCR
jgi:4-hydroxybenzoate polyprenyltransferase